jgi:hypothetical protein
MSELYRFRYSFDSRLYINVEASFYVNMVVVPYFAK